MADSTTFTINLKDGGSSGGGGDSSGRGAGQGNAVTQVAGSANRLATTVDALLRQLGASSGAASTGGSILSRIPGIGRAASIASGIQNAGAPIAQAILRAAPKAGSGAVAATASTYGVAAAPGAAGVSSAGAAAAGVLAPLAASLGPIAIAAGAATVAVGGLAYAAKATNDALLARAEQLGEFSGAIASASAGGEVARLREELYAARQLGSDLAKLTSANDRIGLAQQQIMDRIYEAMAKSFLPLMQQLALVADVISQTLNIIRENAVASSIATESLVQGITSAVAGPLGTLALAGTRVASYFGVQEDKEGAGLYAILEPMVDLVPDNYSPVEDKEVAGGFSGGMP